MGSKTHTISTTSSYNSFAVPASIIQTEPFIECRLKYNTSSMEAKTKVEKHKEIVDGLNKLYEAKNADYGDSVHDTYMKYGLTSFLVRLEDKLNRVRTLSKQEAKVKDEKIEDTLLDMANYAILAVLELRAGQESSTNE